MAEALRIASSVSLDGRTFDYEAELGSPILVGDLLMLGVGQSASLLVQIMTKDRAEGGSVRGAGTVLGRLEEGVLSPPEARPFSSAAFSRADPRTLELLVSPRGPMARSERCEPADSQRCCSRTLSTGTHFFVDRVGRARRMRSA